MESHPNMLNIQFGTFLVLVSNVCGMLFFFFYLFVWLGFWGSFLYVLNVQKVFVVCRCSYLNPPFPSAVLMTASKMAESSHTTVSYKLYCQVLPL